MQQYKKIKIIISGGGTGGHVFPAIAIAQALSKKIKDAEILFVGALGKLEMEKVPAAGYKIIGLNISGLQRRLTYKNLSFPFKLISSLLKAKKIIKNFKPDIVVGVGGYASGPVLRIATKMGIPTIIQEQNSYPGITNKILAHKVDKICVAYKDMEKFFPKSKIYLTGNPVREEVIDTAGKKDNALQFFNLNPEQKTVLIIGGSLGARTINESVIKHLPLFSEHKIQLIWQTGKTYYGQVFQLALHHKNVRIFEFITQMDLAYAAADIIVSRAGAIAVSEISAIKKPAILIPSPFVAEDHQTKNAMALVNYNAAILLPDKESGEKLGDTIIDLLNDDEKQKKLSKNISELAFENAADNIATLIINTIK